MCCLIRDNDRYAILTKKPGVLAEWCYSTNFIKYVHDDKNKSIIYQFKNEIITVNREGCVQKFPVDDDVLIKI